MSLRDLAHVAAEDDAALQSTNVAESQSQNVKLPSMFTQPQLFYQTNSSGISYLIPAHYSIDGASASLGLAPLSPYPFPSSHPSTPMLLSADTLPQNTSVRPHNPTSMQSESTPGERPTKKRRLSESSDSGKELNAVNSSSDKVKDRRKSNSTHEKNRRDKLNEGFERVRSLIPLCKPNKAGVLESAHELILHLQADNLRLAEENASLTRELDALRRQIQFQTIMSTMSQQQQEVHQQLKLQLKGGGPSQPHNG